MMPRLNELSLPGFEAARARVEPLFARIDELGSLRGRPLVDRLPDPEQRETALERLEIVADQHGRGALLDATRAAVREALLTRGSEGRLIGHHGLDLHTAWSVPDEVAAVAAIEDAVAVAITEDLLDPADAVALSTPGRRLLALPALDLQAARRPPVGLGVTAEADEAEGDEAEGGEAEAGEAETDGIDRRARRAAVFMIIAVIAVPAAMTVGTTTASLPLLLVVLAAVLLLTWLFG